MIHYWTCQRVSGGIKCRQINPRRRLTCLACGKRRPPTAKPAHRAILDEMPYEAWVERFGPVCGVCGREPSANRRLDRDHWHSGPLAGQPRGLACARCNVAMPSWMTADWLRAALAYFERSEALILLQHSASVPGASPDTRVGGRAMEHPEPAEDKPALPDRIFGFTIEEAAKITHQTVDEYRADLERRLNGR